MQPYRQSILLSLLFLSVVASIFGLYRANEDYSRQNFSADEFIPRWMGARYWLIEGISPYDEKVSLATQIAIYGHPADTRRGESKGYFLYPLPLMIIIAPFGFFDELSARALWITFLELCFMGVVFLGLRITRWKRVNFAVLLFLTFYFLINFPAVWAILRGHYVVIDALLVTLTVYYLKKGRDLIVGILLAILFLKPGVTGLFIFLILIWAYIKRRQDVIWGFLGGGGLLVAVSFLFIPNWPLKQLQQLWDIREQTISIVNLIARSAPGIQKQISWFLYLSILSLILFEWYRGLRGDIHHLIWSSYITLGLSCIITPFASIANFVLLIPPILLIFSTVIERWGIVGSIIVYISSIGLGIGLWWIVIMSANLKSNEVLLYIAFPASTILGLWWIRWWALHPPRVLLDEFSETFQ